jgi:serine/threonine protein kinase
VATWCGSKVAAKQLHSLTEDPLLAEGVADIVREMNVQSHLRHPNLVLFLGMTYDPATHAPLSILTELLPYSLYDLLEVQKLVFEDVEAVGVGTDVLKALAYLHGQQPPIVHRSASKFSCCNGGQNNATTTTTT